MKKKKRNMNNILYKSITGVLASLIIFTLFSGFLSVIPDFKESGATYAARGGFSWRGHGSDNDFEEERKGNTILRYYSDRCILAYNIDRNGRPIRGSYRWIKSSH